MTGMGVPTFPKFSAPDRQTDKFPKAPIGSHLTIEEYQIHWGFLRRGPTTREPILTSCSPFVQLCPRLVVQLLTFLESWYNSSQLTNGCLLYHGFGIPSTRKDVNNPWSSTPFLITPCRKGPRLYGPLGIPNIICQHFYCFLSAVHRDFPQEKPRYYNNIN